MFSVFLTKLDKPSWLSIAGERQRVIFGRVRVEKNMEGAENPYKVRFLWRRQGRDWKGGDEPRSYCNNRF